MSNYESSTEIRHDIDETRRDMGRKIDAIQDQLSADHLKAKAREVIDDVANSTADSVSEYIHNNMGNIGHTIAGTLKHNPIPAALMGLGLGWLLIESMSDNTPSSNRYPIARYRPTAAYNASPEYYERYGDYPSGASAYAGNGHEQGVVNKAREKVNNAAEAVQEKASEWRNETEHQVNNVTSEAQRFRDEARVQSHLAAMDARDRAADWQNQGYNMAQRAGRSTQNYANQAADYVEHATNEAQHYVQSAAGQVNAYAHSMADQANYYSHQAGQRAYAAGEQVVDTIEENPLAFGAVALAVGAAIGLLLPQTRRENEWVGPYRDQFADAARATATDVVHHAQEAIDEIRPEIEHSAEKVMDDLKEGGQKIVDDLKHTGEKAKSEVKEAAEHTKNVADEKAEAIKNDAAEHAKEGLAV